MLAWLRSHETAIWWIAGASILTFLAFLILVPLLVVRLPSDYFTRRRVHRKLWADQPLVLRRVLQVGKNLLGCIFIVAGMIMLVLPGQGILTLLVGIMLLDFPGKHCLARWIVRRRPVLRTLNWIRRRAGQPPLELDGN
jgi:hypothetical protein